MPRLFLGVDIGGTNMTAGLVAGDGSTAAIRRMSTPRGAGADACMPDLLSACRALIAEAEEPPAGVGIGFGGPVDAVAGTVRRSHHVEGWSGRHLVRDFHDALGLPVFLENDANAGALGEAAFGAGRCCDSVLYVNVGTGIGGGIILGGKIHRGAHGNAAEIGHLVLVPDGPACPCGNRGCLEALASGDAIGRRAREMREAGELDGSALADAPDLTGLVVGEYASAGEPGDVKARGIVAEAGGFLGWGLALAANLLDPSIMVVGGGVSALGDLYLGPARDSFRRFAMEGITDVPLVRAALGYDAGVLGAAAVAMVALAEEH